MKEALIEIVKDTGKLLMKNFEKIRMRKVLKVKGYGDYSITADKLAEKNILKKLRRAGIECNVVTEESGEIDFGYKEQVLFIDPLDGSLNYSCGIPHFCVSIGMQKLNKMVLGIIYDPCREELFLAERNRGAFLNNHRINVSKCRDLRDSFCSFAFGYKNFKRSMEIEERIRRVVRRVRSFGCAGLNFAWVACGRLQAYVDIGLNPWDMAPGALLVEEARGRVTDLKGNKWHPYCNEIIATNGAIHQKLLKIIKEVK